MKFIYIIIAWGILVSDVLAQQIAAIGAHNVNKYEDLSRFEFAVSAETFDLTLPQAFQISTPTIQTSIPFMSDVAVDVKLTYMPQMTYKDYTVWYGRTSDERFDHLEVYYNTIVIYHAATRRLMAYYENDQDIYYLKYDETENKYISYQIENEDFACSPLFEDVKDLPLDALRVRSGLCGDTCTEIDADGKYVYDIFIGFSEIAIRIEPEYEAFALLAVSTVNTGLLNSQMNSGYMRLVGTGITQHNPGVVTSVLVDHYNWFSRDLKVHGADFISSFMEYTGAEGEAGGWGYVPGYSSVNGIRLISAFRHEIGHNVGGGHCPGDGSVFPYAHGYNNGNWTTHLCGNGTNFYSTPLVMDNLGNPIGHAETSDMVRTWVERSETMSNNMLHRVPYYEGDDCIYRPCVPGHHGDESYLINRVVLNSFDNNQADPGWNCPDYVGYSDYTDMVAPFYETGLNSLTVFPNYSWSSSRMSVWIDWNRDGLFIEDNEKIAETNSVGPWAFSFAAPAGVSNEPILMRIRHQYGLPEEYVADPCNASPYNSGETEDYLIQKFNPLSIELITLNGRYSRSTNYLNWQVNTTLPAEKFIVMRSLDGIQFNPVATLSNHDQKNIFTYEDVTGLPYYYKIDVYKDDILIISSNIILLKKVPVAPYTLYPNPADNYIIITSEENNIQLKKLELLDALGQQMHHFNVQYIDNKSLVLNTNYLAPGLYVVRLINKHNEIGVIKFNKI